MSVKPRSRPTTGDSTMKTAIFWKPLAINASHPALATAAPAIAPMIACEELVGRPNHHVRMSQAIAPMRPAKITALVKTDGSTTSFAIVAATAVPKIRNDAKLKNAAHATACCGESTRVDTTVAIEFAASWKPLKKSNDKAMTMMMATVIVMRT